MPMPYLPAAYVVRREVMFSQVCVCSGGGPRFYPRCLVPDSFPGGHTVSGPMSFLGGTPVLGGGGLPQDRGTPQTGQDWGTPLWDRTGVPLSGTGLGYPWLGQDWGTPASQDRTWIPPFPGLVMPRVVCLVRFPAGGLSCCRKDSSGCHLWLELFTDFYLQINSPFVLACKSM